MLDRIGVLAKVVKDTLWHLEVERLVLKEVGEFAVLNTNLVAVKVDHVGTAGNFWLLPQNLQIIMRLYLNQEIVDTFVGCNWLHLSACFFYTKTVF